MNEQGDLLPNQPRVMLRPCLAHAKYPSTDSLADTTESLVHPWSEAKQCPAQISVGIAPTSPCTPGLPSSFGMDVSWRSRYRARLGIRRRRLVRFSRQKPLADKLDGRGPFHVEDALTLVNLVVSGDAGMLFVG